MKTKRLFSILLILFGVILLLAWSGTSVTNHLPTNLQMQDQPPEPDAFLAPDMGCSVIYAADGEVALGGNNEDYSDPFTMGWFLPPEDGKFGRVYFGYEGFIWGGGMNDQGLFFDAMAVGQPVKVPRDGKPSYAGSLPDKVMAECDHVDCVIEIFSQYHSYDTWYHQFLFGDSYGNSVVVEPLNFLRNQKNYQVGTNFYQSGGCPDTCDRYNTATNMFAAADTYSVELVRDILDAVHSDSGSPTQYSQVYDLKTNTVYLYFFHDFENPVVFQLDEELAKGRHSVVLADLFPINQAYQDLAQPKMDWLDEKRAAYPVFEGDPIGYDAITGKYALPPKMGLPYPYYEIAEEDGTLLLKIYSDKGWLDLVPFAENAFYHVSSFAQFEITFLPEENGEVNQFLYEEGGAEYTFARYEEDQTIQAVATATPVPPSPTVTDTPTEIPTNTPEPPTPSVTPTEKPPTATLEQPTPESQPASGTSLWWMIPIVGLGLILGWYLIRRKQ